MKYQKIFPNILKLNWELLQANCDYITQFIDVNFNYAARCNKRFCLSDKARSYSGLLNIIDLLFINGIYYLCGNTMETTATSKGQIVIPSVIRRRMGISAGTRINVEMNSDENAIILRPITREYVKEMRGRLRGKGLMKALMQEKSKESAL